MIMTEESLGVGDARQVGSLKERLQQVADEIDTIKNSFSKSTEELSRVQSMLDVKSLEEISGIIENFESRISEAERSKEEATAGARRYSEELEKEKERLIKLWDAYKNQEQELSNNEKKLAEFEERAKEAEASKKMIEDDLTARIETLNQKLKENEEKANKFDEYKQRYEEFDGIRNRLEEEIRSLKDEVNNRDETINSLQNQINKLKENEKYIEYKGKFEEVSEHYEKEKERLTKLYHLYEESETECNKLKEETKTWQDWFNSNRDIFDRLFSTGPPVATTPMETPKRERPEVFTPPSSPLTEEKIDIEAKTEKKKKKLRFKK